MTDKLRKFMLSEEYGSNFHSKEEEWKYHIDDNYQTLKMTHNQLFEIFKKLIYDLPKKYSTKKEIIQQLRKDKIKFKPKELNSYIDGLDESRLEELVGIIFDSLKKWDGV